MSTARRALAKFKIPSELLNVAGVWHGTNLEVRELLGIHGRDDQDLAGIVFPYRDPLEGCSRGHRVRLDTPTSDGSKYISEQGCRHLFFAPTNDGELTDISVPVVFVEAEKSALAVKALADRSGLKLLLIATGGVWGWRRKCASNLQPDGGRQTVSGPSPSLDLVIWTGRVTTIAFDSNVARRPELLRAQTALARELAGRGAGVSIAEVPCDGGINGPDDLIAIAGDDRALEVFERAKRFIPTNISSEHEERPADSEMNEMASRQKESVATKLINVATADAELFHCGDGGFASIRVDNHTETYALGSQGFRRWLSRRYFTENERAASREALSTAIQTLEGIAVFQGTERAVGVRVHGDLERVYLDLANSAWQVVEISARGWRIIEASHCPVRFRRPRGTLSLPEPERGGQARELREILNVRSDDELQLPIAWLTGVFHPSGPYPILVLHGEQGSAKTTTARFLRTLIDPNEAPLRSEPREVRDLMIAANNGLICVFDNLSGLAPWLSDALCRMSTGGGFSTRALFTNDDEVLFTAKRPVILTGIDELATRGDLLDRAIIIELPRIPEHRYQTEEQFLQKFQKMRPRLLGTLLDGVVAAIANHSHVRLAQVPRMADFAIWVTAAEGAFGLPEGSFVRAYLSNRAVANDLPLETPLAEAIRKLPLPWNGTATSLLKELVSLTNESILRQRSWPSSPQSLSSALRRLAPNLRRAGIDIVFTRDGGTGRRVVAITSVTSPSLSSQTPEPQPVPRVDRDAVRDACDARDDGTETSAAPQTGSPQPEELQRGLEDEL